MKQRFVNKDLRADALRVVKQANETIQDYQDQGYRMTLRQLYYQFVSKNLITNEEKSYKRLASIISDGRLAGLIDWSAIEDRGRVPSTPHHYADVDAMLRTIKDAASAFTLDKWMGQSVYVELWVEKQALASVLEPLAEQHHVTLMVNKGYSSQSAMYDAARRFREGMQTTGELDGHLFYLGDHDPSGEDMVRDIRDRLLMFGVDRDRFQVTKVALTTAQVRQHNPPPNPAKITDPRAAAYIERHGNSSWEVDALPPNVLSRLVSTAIQSVVDEDAWDGVVEREARERKQLVEALDKIEL